MNVILGQIAVLYIFILVGWGFGKWKKDQAEKSGILSFLLVNLMLPAMVFRSFARDFTVTYITENYLTLVISTVLLALIAGVALLLCRVFSKDAFERNVYHYSMTIPNISYMAFVLAQALLGDRGLANAILFGIPLTLYIYTIGYAMLTGGGNSLKKLINPNTVAVALGVVAGLLEIPIPGFLDTVLSSSAACVGPLGMLLAGFVLSAFPIKEMAPDWKVLGLCVIRLAVLPALMFGACKLLGLVITLPEAVYPSAVLIACMPCGLNSVIFPKLMGKDCSLGAKIALYSHLLSVVTIPLWLGLIL